MQSTIAANSRIIYDSMRNNLTSGQIANWRMSTYTDLNSNKKYTIEELKTFMDLDNDGLYDNYVPEFIIKNVIDKLMRGELEQDKIWFLMIDSCTMCTKIVEPILKYIRKELGSDAYIILINNNINKIENQYKLINKNNDKYTNINFNILNENLAYLNGKYLDGDVYMNDGTTYDVILESNIYHENQLLTNAEDDIMDESNGYWIGSYRNEANDDAQILLLNDYMSYIQDSNGLMITIDNGLIEKINNKKNSCLYYYRP